MNNRIPVTAAIGDRVFPAYISYRFDDSNTSTARVPPIQVAEKTNASRSYGAIASRKSPFNLGESRVKLKARSLNGDHLLLNGDH